MKRLVVFLAVVALLLVAADFLLRNATESAVAGLVDDRVTQADPEVDVSGFPFVVSLFRGRFDQVTISLPAVKQDVVTVKNVSLTFEDVAVDPFDLLGGRGTVRANSVTGGGAISESDFARIVARYYPEVTVDLLENEVTMSRAGVSAPATAVVAANRILISAGPVAEPVEIPLPSLMRGVQFSSLEVHEDRVVLRVEGSRVRIRV